MAAVCRTVSRWVFQESHLPHCLFRFPYPSVDRKVTRFLQPRYLQWCIRLSKETQTLVSSNSAVRNTTLSLSYSLPSVQMRRGGGEGGHLRLYMSRHLQVEMPAPVPSLHPSSWLLFLPPLLPVVGKEEIFPSFLCWGRKCLQVDNNFSIARILRTFRIP